MKQLKRIAAVVLTGAMALTMLAGCGGSSGSGSSTDEIKLINIMLQAADSEITVKEDEALAKQAESYVGWISQNKKIPTDVADDPDNAEYYDVRRYNEYVNSTEDYRIKSLYNNNILVLDVGNYEFRSDDGWGTNDEQRANDLAWWLINLQNGDDTYYNGEDDIDLSGMTVTGIGIAEADGLNLNIWTNDCARNCDPSHVSHDEDYYRDNDWENNYLSHTQEFDGWIVLVSFTR